MVKDVSEAVRRQIFALSNQGFSQRQFAAKIDVSKGAVQQKVERFRKN
jgi:transposase